MVGFFPAKPEMSKVREQSDEGRGECAQHWFNEMEEVHAGGDMLPFGKSILRPLESWSIPKTMYEVKGQLYEGRSTVLRSMRVGEENRVA